MLYVSHSLGFYYLQLCAKLKGKFLPANHLYYGVVLNTLNVLINANQDISQVKDIKWTVAIVEDPAVNAVVLPVSKVKLQYCCKCYPITS